MRRVQEGGIWKLEESIREDEPSPPPSSSSDSDGGLPMRIQGPIKPAVRKSRVKKGKTKKTPLSNIFLD